MFHATLFADWALRHAANHLKAACNLLKVVRVNKEVQVSPSMREAVTQASITTKDADCQHTSTIVGTGPLGMSAVQKLGRGQFGEVCRVRAATGVEYAMKRIPLGRSNVEMESWCVGLSHKNVIRTHGYLLDDAFQYLLIDLHQGDLLDYIKGNGYISEEESRWLLTQMMAGLGYIHAQGIVHRDLKPENVLLSSSGVPVIGDFGLAAKPNGGKIRGIVGTVLYMAPEVLRDECYDWRVDLWSIGVIFFTMLNGYNPFHTIEQTLVGDHDVFGYDVSHDDLEIFKSLIEVDPGSRDYLGN